MTKKYFFFFAIMLSLLWFLPTVPDFVRAAGKPGNAQAGMEVHKRQCVRCHGETGKGDGPGSAVLKTKPADWTDAARMSGVSEAEMFQVIKDGGTAAGKSKLMPAFGAKLKDQEISDVIAVIKSFQNGKR
ncbi:MAG: cytochrome c [Acidobacteria bacterium]|nr:cytochrome c [Acidobacteriota bacterium]